MNQTVQDGIGQRWISDEIMPVVDGELTGDEGRLQSVPVIEDFEQISSMFVFEGGSTEVVEHQQVSFGQSSHQFGVAAVAFGDNEIPEETRGPGIQGGEAIAAGFMGQSTG